MPVTEKSITMANNSYMSENSTLQFSFCLYENGQSAKNCASGLFSSLPLQTKDTLWSKVFKAEHENVTRIIEATSTATEKMHNPTSVITGLTISVITAVILSTTCIAASSYIKLKRRWKNENAIRIDEEMLDNELNGFKRIKSQTGEENESISLLQFETECNTSCKSDGTSSTGYASDDMHSHSDSERSIRECLVSIAKPELNHDAEDVEQKSRIKPSSGYISFHRRNAPQFEYNVMKTNVTVLQSPDKTSGKDDNPNNTVVPTDTQVSNVTKVDLKKLDWTKIFLFLIKQIYPSKYRQFFHVLLDNAGCKDTEWHISTTEFNKRGKIEEIIFELFQVWKNGVGPTANTKSIENVFETLVMNVQLVDFRNFLRDPPYLPEETTWNDQSFPCISTETMIAEPQQLALQQNTIPQIQEIGSFQRPTQTKLTAIPSNNDTGPVSENIQYVMTGQKLTYHRNAVRRKGDDINDIQTKLTAIPSNNDTGPVSENIQYVMTGQKLTYHRNAVRRKGDDINDIQTKLTAIPSNNDTGPVSENIQYVMTGQKLTYPRNAVRRKGDDINEIRSKYSKVQISSVNEANVNRKCLNKRCRSIFRSHQGKKIVTKTYVPSLRKKAGVLSQPLSSTMSSSASSFAPSSTSFSCYSSGYGSMSSSNVALETGQVIPNNLWNENNAERTFPENGCPAANDDFRHSTSTQGNPPQMPAKRTKEMLHSTEPVTRHQTDTSFQSTSSWNVTQTEPAFPGPGVVKDSQKRKRAIHNKKPYKRQVNRLSKKSFMSHRQERINGKQFCNRTRSRADELAYTAGLNELFFEDFLSRITPSRKDILSIKFRSYSDADCFVTKLNENVYVIFSEGHCLAVREREWNTLQLYVNKVRTRVSKFDEYNDFLFLNHKGEPLI